MLLLPACADDDAGTPERAALTSTTTTIAATTTTTTELPVVEIAIRFERRALAGTEGFESLARETLTDPRGWQQAGFRFTFADDAPYTVFVGEAGEVDAACLPYDTFGRFSCQLGPVVALNADRWREAVPEWPGSLDDYRRMLVNHEVGHLVGRHHADACTADGEPAPVMFQQSSGVGRCAPNPWPLPWELACAARHDEPVAPGYEADAEATCGPDQSSANGG